jgi:hypothetical protein
MSTSSGELRELLVSCIDEVKAGNLDFNDAKAIALLAQQVNLSLQVELNVRRDGGLGSSGIGALPLGEDRVIDVTPKEAQA